MVVYVQSHAHILSTCGCGLYRDFLHDLGPYHSWTCTCMQSYIQCHACMQLQPTDEQIAGCTCIIMIIIVIQLDKLISRLNFITHACVCTIKMRVY